MATDKELGKVRKWTYKDANRIYWTVTAQVTEFTKEDENDYWETEWYIEIHQSAVDFRKDVWVFSGLRNTQYDELISLGEIILSWLNNVNSVALGMMKYERVTDD